MEQAILLASRRIVGSPKRADVRILKELEWRRLEEAVAHYFRAADFQAATGSGSNDGGIDLRLFRDGDPVPVGIVQCKARNSGSVEVKVIRETVGALSTVGGNATAYVVTTGGFTKPAVEFARTSKARIELWDCEELAKRVNQLPEAALSQWLKVVFADDYHTPTCVECKNKMRTGADRQGTPRWECTRTRKCAGLTMPMRRTDQAIFRHVAATRAAKSHPRITIIPSGGAEAGIVSVNADRFPHAAAFSPSRQAPPAARHTRVPPLHREGLPHTVPPPARNARRKLAAVVMMLLTGMFVVVWFGFHRRAAPFMPGPTREPKAVPGEAVAPRAPSVAPSVTAASKENPAANSRPTPRLLRYVRPPRVFHLAVEGREPAGKNQTATAIRVAEQTLSLFSVEARPPFLAIATHPSNAKLDAYLIYDTQTLSLVSTEAFVTHRQPTRTIAMLHRYECFFASDGETAQ